MSDEEDEVLLHRLAEAAAAIDPPPERWREVARASLSWRPVDAELARLLHDSADPTDPAGSPASTGVRAAAGPRQLSYADEDRLLELEITRQTDGLTLLGQVVPAAAGELVVHRPGGASTALAVDHLGRFRLERLPDEPFAVEVRSEPGSPSLWTGLIQP